MVPSSDRDEYDLVLPHLSNYHILIPDLPSHGEAMHIQPFTLPSTSDLLARLIKEKAHNGKAHLVGVSLGGHVVVDLAWRHGDVVETVLASGYNLYAPTMFTPIVPVTAFAVQHATQWIPLPIVRWAMAGTDFRRMKKGACTLSTSQQIVATCVSDEWPNPSSARVLIVAATMGPIHDRIPDAIKLRDIEKKGNPESRAVQHKQMKHPWNRQDPALFAEIVRSWIEGSELHAGFEEL
jgi:pimeloyl-ACP methyl ester carboxylesterase